MVVLCDPDAPAPLRAQRYTTKGAYVAQNAPACLSVGRSRFGSFAPLSLAQKRRYAPLLRIAPRVHFVRRLRPS